MSKIPNQPFILVDGSSYLFRAFHALPPLTTSKGIPTGAFYGVMNMIRKLIKDYNPTYMAVVFDPKGKTFRDELYPLYKAHRPPMPNELSVQIAPLFEMIEAMGIPLIIVENYEADDVIGTLTQVAIQHNLYTLISTGDKDLAQLVNEHVTLINTMTGAIYDIEGVEAKFGVPPRLIIDYLALIGDTSDNIPGVPKVGPKTAVKWLLEYGSIDNLIAQANAIKGVVGDNLRNNIDQLKLSQKLVTIKDDIPLNFTPETLQLKPRALPKLIEMSREYEFKAWLSDLLKQEETKASPATNFQTLSTNNELTLWLKKLANSTQFVVSLYTDNVNSIYSNIIGIALAAEDQSACYIPVGHDYENCPAQLDTMAVLQQLKPYLEDAKYLKIGHDLKYVISILANHNISLQGVSFDLLLEGFVLASGSRLDVNSLALKYLGYRTTTLEDIAGSGVRQLKFNQITIEKVSQYACENAKAIHSLHKKLWPQITSEKGLNHVFHNIEMPLIPILSKMERTGVLIDAKMLQAQSKDLALRIKEIEDKVYLEAGIVFNLGSPKQLQEILYGRMGYPILQRTPGGQPSTAEAVLQELSLNFSLPKLLLEHRSLCKLKSTYTDKLPTQINDKTHRVHTTYHQTGALTGRFSSSDPNLQNIPIRNDEGRKIRKAFIAPPHYTIIAADYSQIELRIMAHLSGDPGLINAFNLGLDIHKATAAEVFSVPLEDVTPLQRRSAKAINFGLIYGMSSFGLAKQLDITRSDAEAYIALYFERYPGVKKYMNEIRTKAHQMGYVETLFGRRLYLPEINVKNLQRQKAAERAAINAPMQGTAADIIKTAMINVEEALRVLHDNVKMIMQVHDELIFEAHENCIEQAKEIIVSEMSHAVKLSIPLVVDIGIGNNWDEAH